MQNYLDN
jgi:hypothetical protein